MPTPSEEYFAMHPDQWNTGSGSGSGGRPLNNGRHGTWVSASAYDRPSSSLNETPHPTPPSSLAAHSATGAFGSDPRTASSQGSFYPYGNPSLSVDPSGYAHVTSARSSPQIQAHGASNPSHASSQHGTHHPSSHAKLAPKRAATAEPASPAPARKKQATHLSAPQLNMKTLDLAIKTYPQVKDKLAKMTKVEKKLGDRPALREAKIRTDGKREAKAAHELNVGRTGNLNRLFVQMSGEVAAEECTYCHRGLGHWDACVILEGMFGGACANCAWNGDNRRCTHYTGDGEKGKKQKGDKSMPDVFSTTYPYLADQPALLALLDSELAKIPDTVALQTRRDIEHRLRAEAKTLAMAMCDLQLNYPACDPADEDQDHDYQDDEDQTGGFVEDEAWDEDDIDQGDD